MMDGKCARRRRHWRTLLMLTSAVPLMLSCGSVTPVSPGGAAPPPTHTVPLTVMIMETGPTPRDITVVVGATVTFMNHDTVPHGVAGGASPAQPGCPEIDAVGVLEPGDIRSTLPFTSVRSCEYHDPRGGSDTFTGRIVVR
jgi:plastocyanin